jgi:ATP-dependent Lhr-like helicase
MGWCAVLKDMREGRITRVAVDLPEPSVLSHQMLNSAPWTFLDEAPLEERRARAVSVRRSLPSTDEAAFGALDQSAIDQVREDAKPVIRDAEELHDALLQLGVLPTDAATSVLLERAARGALLSRRRTSARGSSRCSGRRFVFAAERVPLVQAMFPDVALPLVRAAGRLAGRT